MRYINQLICAGIALATLGIYAQTANFAFINYDDPEYVSNRHVRQGLGVESVEWAFTTVDDFSWMPVTLITHVVDRTLYGSRSGPEHVENAVLHCLASVMVFWFLLRATGARWPSAFVGCLFAVHPLHVESVAWVAERKDVLCGLFWFLTLWAWVLYAARPNWWRYLRALLFFCLGIMSKPMMVSLPAVLVLLDWWPLGRRLSRRTVWEKIPFAAISLAVCMVTFLAQRAAGAVQTLETFGFLLRTENSFLAWLIYPLKTVWPTRLAVFYPFPESLPPWALLAGLALAGISVLAWRLRHRFGYLATGWFWYLATTLPVIGLLQVGEQSRADRYMYIPMVGLAIPVVWGAAEMVARRPSWKPWFGMGAVVVLAGYGAAAWRQAGYWRNSETLFRHAIAVTDGNYVAWQNLGNALTVPGHMEGTIEAFRMVVRLRPETAVAHSILGGALVDAGRVSEGWPEFEIAEKLNPHYWPVLEKKGLVLAHEAKYEEAMREFRAAIQAKPSVPSPHANLGAALAALGRTQEALAEEEEAVRLDPEETYAHFTMGGLLMKMGEPDAAADEYLTTIRLDPNYAEAHLFLGEALLRLGRTMEGVSHLQLAVEIDPRMAEAQFRLAVVLAQMGRGDEALGHMRAAVALNPNAAWSGALREIERRK